MPDTYAMMIITLLTDKDMIAVVKVLDNAHR